MSTDEAQFLLTHFAMEHQRESCDDQHPINWSGNSVDHGARCNRCALLKAIAEPEFAKDVQLPTFDLKVSYPYGW